MDENQDNNTQAEPTEPAEPKAPAAVPPEAPPAEAARAEASPAESRLVEASTADEASAPSGAGSVLANALAGAGFSAAPSSTPAKREDRPPRTEQQPRGEGQPRGDRGPRPTGGGRGGDRGPRPEGGPRPERAAGERGPRPGGDRPGGDRGPRPSGGGQDRREGGRPGARPFEPMADIDIEKLISDSLYLDNQAHAVVARMRDMDSGTKSQLRRLFNAVRRAVGAPEGDRQHQFVMLRARLAYTIARHSLRSLDGLERLLLQVTRKNEMRGYERFKDLFEAIVAYNE
ncbi:MAG: type III-A CRISPR-associated protein Csm2 [Acidobacteriota bacterium]